MNHLSITMGYVYLIAFIVVVLRSDAQCSSRALAQLSDRARRAPADAFVVAKGLAMPSTPASTGRKRTPSHANVRSRKEHENLP